LSRFAFTISFGVTATRRTVIALQDDLIDAIERLLADPEHEKLAKRIVGMTWDVSTIKQVKP
jgi:hypothetical protein